MANMNVRVTRLVTDNIAYVMDFASARQYAFRRALVAEDTMREGAIYNVETDEEGNDPEKIVSATYLGFGD